jgi:hypothetical protein
MAADPNDQHVMNVCKFFWPCDTLPSAVTDPVRLVAARALYNAIRFSNAMDLVPRPAGIKPGAAWLVSQGVKIFFRTQSKTRIYELVRKGVSLKMRGEYLAAQIATT